MFSTYTHFPYLFTMEELKKNEVKVNLWYALSCVRDIK